MPEPTFLQIHTLTSYPGTLLNRDDAGFAKRLPFGGATRTRVSSQCLKYHWRNFDGQHALYRMEDVPRSLRSRETFKRRVAQPLIDEGYPPRLVVPFARQIQARILSDGNLSKTDFKKLIDPDEDTDLLAELKLKQVTILGKPEVDYVRSLVREQVDALRDDLGALWDDPQAKLSTEQVDRAYEVLQSISKGDLKKNLKGLRLASGLDAALFGRMATSDVLARGDAAIHVAHALTTHEEESESDYFSAVDELVAREGEGELGSGHINSQELTSGLFYGYVVVDVPLLVSNLEGARRDAWREADRTLAAEVGRRLVHLVATVSPGAKLGSTAPHAYAQCLFAEAGTAQPRTLANAFQQAVTTNGRGVLANSYAALGRYVGQMDEMYGRLTERRLAAIEPTDGFAGALSVDGTSPVPEIADWAAQQVRGGAA